MEWFAVCNVLLCLRWGNIVVFFEYMLSSRNKILSSFDWKVIKMFKIYFFCKYLYFYKELFLRYCKS